MTDLVYINGAVVGTDGNSPIYQPDGRWCWWSIAEVYTGVAGLHKYVPKVLDFVIDPSNYTVYRVEHLDPVTLIPTLLEIRPANMSFSISETDVLFGVGPGTQSDTYRVYIDTSVLPHILAVDIRLKVGGSMASYAKIFKGADLGDTGHVISKVYDNSGNFISENVPLELVAIDSHVNYSIKTISVCHAIEDLVDGEIVTAVIYNDNGHVVSKRQLLVENTSFIRSLNVSQKFVSHISIETPFISPTLDHVIEFPLNIPLNALNIMGLVHYSNGDILRLPVDGTKFRMYGLEQYLSTIVGQKVDLVLSYGLSVEEVAYGGVTSDGHFITEPYSLETINPNNSYTVKLFGYPKWIDDSVGYIMQWWLFNLDRNVFFDVTPYVKWAENTGAFDPKGYGYMQRKAVSINLRDISGSFKPFVHTQLVEIVLNGRPNDLENPWTVSHESVSNRPSYGASLFAKKVNNTTVNIGANISEFVDWKQKVYLQAYPLLDRTIEINPPSPTHFVLTYAGTSIEYLITDWNVDLNLGINLPQYSTVSIRFVKRTASGDMQLGISCMIVRP